MSLASLQASPNEAMASSMAFFCAEEPSALTVPEKHSAVASDAEAELVVLLSKLRHGEDVGLPEAVCLGPSDDSLDFC